MIWFLIQMEKTLINTVFAAFTRERQTWDGVE